MKLKKIWQFAMILLTIVTLSACQTKKNTDLSETKASQIKPQNEEMRLNFNKIGLANIGDEVTGGTTLEELKALFGEPESHTTQNGGDVTLDVYTWRKDETTLVTQLYDNHAIARAISNFRFIRKPKITIKTFDSLTNDMSFSNAITILGDPDVMSQSVSSNGEEITAIWSSGFKSSNLNSNIELKFTNNQLKTKKQYGLK